MMRMRWTSISLALALALCVVACSDDGSTSNGTESTDSGDGDPGDGDPGDGDPGDGDPTGDGDGDPCSPITDDASAIGQDCMNGQACPMGYTCQPFIGFVLEERCQILCNEDCDCPQGTNCEMVQDKANVWMQCQ